MYKDDLILGRQIAAFELKECIPYFTKWRIHPFNPKGMIIIIYAHSKTIDNLAILVYFGLEVFENL